MSRALCLGAGSSFPDLWFSDVEAEREEAKRICDRCTQAPGCLRGALERGETAGVWAGMWLGAVELAEPVAWEPQVFAPVHGNRSSYVGGCHCRECTSANTRFMAEWRTQHRFASPALPAPDRGEQLDLLEALT